MTIKKLLKDSYPDLFNEIHPTRNENRDVSQLYENSSVKIYWQCQVNPKHIFYQSVGNRTKGGRGCPYCSGRLTLPEDSFAALFPNLAKEVHPTKNVGFDPFKYRPYSEKKIWWKCKNGHEWMQRIGTRTVSNSKCRECYRRENSLATKYPDIAKEWHPTKNGDLKPEDVLIYHKKRIWWRCNKNPLHEWQVQVRARVKDNSGCPECAKQTRQEIEYPSLEKYNPALAKQWHPTKNGALIPSDIKPNSTLKVHWVCQTNPSHEWSAILRNRAIQGKGCPICARTRVSAENSFAQHFPKIAEQWHPIKNGNLRPSDFSYGSSQKAWWQCPLNNEHEWQTTITGRTQNPNAGCPICRKELNSLEAIYPVVAKQWHPTKNGKLKPSQVPKAGRMKVWWQCQENPDHEWEAVIKNRTVLGSGCPECAKEKNTIRLSEHLFDLVNSDIDYYHICLKNFRTLSNIIEFEIDNPRLTQPFYRMVYSSVITALEAYLSDGFYKKVITDESLIEKFIKSNPEFSERKYRLTEVLDWQKNIEKRVKEYLFNIIWHNILKVQALYNAVLGVNFPDDITNILKAISIRHDIIHRNGRTKDGRTHKLKKGQILKLISDTKALIEHINKQMIALKTEPKG